MIAPTTGDYHLSSRNRSFVSFFLSRMIFLFHWTRVNLIRKRIFPGINDSEFQNSKEELYRSLLLKICSKSKSIKSFFYSSFLTRKKYEELKIILNSIEIKEEEESLRNEIERRLYSFSKRRGGGKGWSTNDAGRRKRGASSNSGNKRGRAERWKHGKRGNGRRCRRHGEEVTSRQNNEPRLAAISR